MPCSGAAQGCERASQGRAGLKVWPQAGLLLSGAYSQPRCASPGACLPEGLAGFLRQICGKGLELIGAKIVSACRLLHVERCVGGGGLFFSCPRLRAVSLRPGQEEDWAECPPGPGVRTTIALLPSSASEPSCSRWHVGLAVLPTRGAGSSTRPIRRPLCEQPHWKV